MLSGITESSVNLSVQFTLLVNNLLYSYLADNINLYEGILHIEINGKKFYVLDTSKSIFDINNKPNIYQGTNSTIYDLNTDSTIYDLNTESTIYGLNSNSLIYITKTGTI
jgi:hypothetical protein